MGNSPSCSCSNSSKEGVLLMRGNGSLIKLKKGIHAKDVMDAHAGHRVVKCGSDRLVLLGSAELECNRFYFLMPEDLARCREAYDRFWCVAECKGLVPAKRTNVENDQRDQVDGGMINRQLGMGQVLTFEACDLKRFTWKPQLQTVPEITSPSLSISVKESSPVESRRKVE